MYLIYEPTRKAYALLTLPELTLTYSVEVRFVEGAFPLRSSNSLTRELDGFLRPTAEDIQLERLHGPANMMRRRYGQELPDDSTVVETPVQAETRSAREREPSAKALDNIASQ